MTATSTPAPAPQPAKRPSAAYRLSRSWHEWLGLISSLLICLVSLTGIYLNHRDIFSPSPAANTERQGGRPSEGGRPGGTGSGEGKHGEGKPGGRPRQGGGKLSPRMLTQSDSFAKALEQVQQAWGSEAPIESIMIRRDGRGLVWRFQSPQGSEIHIDAMSLQVLTNRQGNRSGRSLVRIIHDLHTGQIVGMTGKIIVDLVALTMVILSVTGWILWIKPRLLRRKKKLA